MLCWLVSGIDNTELCNNGVVVVINRDKSTLVISTSVVSNNRLSRRENLVLVLI